MWGRRIGKKNPWRKFSFNQAEHKCTAMQDHIRELRFRGAPMLRDVGSAGNRLRSKQVMDNERLVCA